MGPSPQHGTSGCPVTAPAGLLGPATGQAALHAPFSLTPPSRPAQDHASRAARHQPLASLLSTSFSAYITRGGSWPCHAVCGYSRGTQASSSISSRLWKSWSSQGGKGGCRSPPQSYEISILGVRLGAVATMPSWLLSCRGRRRHPVGFIEQVQ